MGARMYDLAKSHNIKGFWIIYYENNEQSEEVFGILSHEPQKGSTLDIILKGNSEQLNFLENFPPIIRVVGQTNSGTCFMFDCFFCSSHRGSDIATYSIYANIVSFAKKSDQVVGEEYTTHDLKAIDEKVFCQCRFEINDLFKFIYHTTRQSKIKEERDLFNFYTNTKGVISRDITSKINTKLEENFVINLPNNLKLQFFFSLLEYSKFIGVPAYEYNLYMKLNSENKSIEDFIHIIKQIQSIFTVIFDNKNFNLSYVSCDKDVYSVKKESDFTCEEHDILFNEPIVFIQDYYFSNRLIFNSLKHLSSAISSCFDLIKNYPDLFKLLPETDSKDPLSNLISLVKIIDSSCTYLSDTNFKPKENGTLKEKLKACFSDCNDKDISDSITFLSKPNLESKLLAVVRSAQKITGINIDDEKNDSYIQVAKRIRNKDSHGEIYKHLRKGNVSHIDLLCCSALMRAVIYTQLFKKLKINEDKILQTKSILAFNSYVKLKNEK